MNLYDKYWDKKLKIVDGSTAIGSPNKDNKEDVLAFLRGISNWNNANQYSALKDLCDNNKSICTDDKNLSLFLKEMDILYFTKKHTIKEISLIFKQHRNTISKYIGLLRKYRDLYPENYIKHLNTDLLKKNTID